MRERDCTTLRQFYRGKRIFLTGHTGFVGSWLSLWLAELGASIHGFSLPPAGKGNLFEEAQVATVLESHWTGDVRDYEALTRAVQQARPEVVFHLAAQPLVRRSYREPRETYETNVIGTVNLLEALRLLDSGLICEVITTDKCYENREWVYAYREADSLGGQDPYSSSKACAELAIAAYRRSFFTSSAGQEGVRLASIRAGNIIGGGDWAEDRLVPDCIRALQNGEPIRLRCPHAVRPWQHVLEPLSGCLWLALQMARAPARFCDAWNLGPAHGAFYSVARVVEEIVAAWGSGEWVDASQCANLPEAGLLLLSIDKALAELRWSPTWDLPAAVQHTVAWYRGFYSRRSGEPVSQACREDIQSYVDCARQKGLVWSS